MNDYVAKMDQLRSGELDHLEIKPAEFMKFRQAWTDYPYRQDIVGTAQRNGVIIYRYHHVE